MRSAIARTVDFSGPLSDTAARVAARSLTSRRWASIFFPLAAGAAALGCAQGRLLPAASAQVIPDVPSAAAFEDSGIRVSAEANDWSAAPEDLPERLTPIKVRIVNRSGAPVQILYQKFALLGGHGRRYQPLPPAPLDDPGTPSVRPVYAASNFFVAPRLHGVYPTLDAWSVPLDRDDEFYARQVGRWADGLPSRPMRRMALPEGVLADRGEISGFLYFENATRKEKRVTFHADMDQPQGEEVAEIEIPFVVH